MIVSAQTAGKGSPTPSLEALIGMPASNGVIITEEMFEAAEVYAEDVIGEMMRRNIFDVKVEERVEAPSVHAKSFGTVDSFLFDLRGLHLIIWDYKYGYGLVEAFENWQGINYYAAIADKLKINGNLDQELTVEIRIAQPRAFHPEGPIRSWVVKGSDLRGKVNILAANAAKALSDDATLQTGEHCRYCQARTKCKPAIDAGLHLYEAAGTPTPIEITPDALGLQLAIVTRAAKHLKSLQSGYEEQVKALIRSGVSVPGWSNEPSRGRECWAKPPGEVMALGDMLGQELRKPGALITPKQARDLGIDKDLVAAYSHIPQTGLKLVPDTGQKARRIFQS
jgi:hypothetical protein